VIDRVSDPFRRPGRPLKTQFRTATAALPANAQAQIPAIPGTLTALSGLPEAWDPARFATSGAFSFLEEVRPLFSLASMPAAPAVPLDTAKIPTETDLRALADELSTVPVPRIPETGLASAAPQISGAPVSPNPSEVSTGYAFLNEIRQLVALPALETSVASPVSSGDISALNLSSEPFDVASIRRDFPILEERVNGKPLIWLDNAATTQKPKSVIDRLSHFYTHENSNIHRAAHELAARATYAYEAAREKVRRFLNAPSTKEIIFVRGATEGINLLAQSWGRQNVRGAMKSSSPGSSTTPTSFRGRCCAQKQVRACASLLWTIRGKCCWMNITNCLARRQGSSPSHKYRTPSAQ
jgi:cysteine desulfurase/selenocysteine lyase